MAATFLGQLELAEGQSLGGRRCFPRSEVVSQPRPPGLLGDIRAGERDEPGDDAGPQGSTQIISARRSSIISGMA